MNLIKSRKPDYQTEHISKLVKLNKNLITNKNSINTTLQIH